MRLVNDNKIRCLDFIQPPCNGLRTSNLHTCGIVTGRSGRYDPMINTHSRERPIGLVNKFPPVHKKQNPLTDECCFPGHPAHHNRLACSAGSHGTDGRGTGGVFGGNTVN